MLVLDGTALAEITIKNSRFISEVFSVKTSEEARDKLRERKEFYADGAHVVHAFVVGRSGGTLGCSDDGEPSGTAGYPTLEVLKGSGITNILLTTARYFGGIKLGTGGLVKAYTQSAQGVLAVARTHEYVPMARFSVSLPYNCYEMARKSLLAQGAAILTEAFAAEASFTGRIQAESISGIQDSVRDISRGQALFESVLEDEF